MERETKLNEFKKEFLEDIESVKVEIEDLKKCKISNCVLEAETMLRKVFGDEIYIPKKAEENITGEKEIVKLDEEDIAFDGQVREICETLPNEEFDNNVGLLLSKIQEEEN